MKEHLILKLDTIERLSKVKVEYLTATQGKDERVLEFARRLYSLYRGAGGDLNKQVSVEMTELNLIKRFEDGLKPNLSLAAISKGLSC